MFPSGEAVEWSSVLNVGDQYEVRNVQDYLGSPVLSGTYNGDPISLSVTGLTAGRPFGMTNTQNTGKEFNVFVVIGKK